MEYKEIVAEIVDFGKKAPKSVFKRGIELFITLARKISVEEEIVNDDEGTYFILVDVPSQSGLFSYSVTFGNNQDNFGDCGCGFNEENAVCKHMVAASLFLHKEYGTSGKYIYIDQTPQLFPSLAILDQPRPEYSFRIPLFKVTINGIQILTRYADQQAVSRRGSKSVTLKEIELKKRWVATVKLQQEVQKVSFYCDDSNHLVLERSVKEPDALYLNRFEAAALQQAVYTYSHQFFQSLINRDQEKNLLLKQYGLSMADPEAKIFKFSTSYRGDLECEAPENILKLNDSKQFSTWLNKLNIAPQNDISSSENRAAEIQELGLLFNFSHSSSLGFSFDAFRIIQLASKRSFKKMTIKNKEDVVNLKALPPEVQLALMRLTDKSIEQRINGINDRYYYYDKHDPKVVNLIQNFYFDFFHQHLEYLSAFPFLYKLDAGANFGATTLKPITISKERFSLAFKVEIEEKMVSLEAFIVLGKKKTRLKKSSLSAGFIADQNDILYFPRNREDISVCNTFRDGGIKIHKDGIQNFLTQIVIPLSNKYPVEFPEGFETEVYRTIDEKAIYLRELSEKFLLIQPAFKYGSTVLEYDGTATEQHTTLNENTITHITRQKKQENEFIKWMKTLHPDFGQQFSNPYFYVSFTQAMKDRWFIDFCHTLKEAGVSVYGINELKKFKYNTNKPVFELKAGSGIDWFDLQIEVHFGEQLVGIKELRKAMINKDPYILLDDGTIGVLPNEWFEKYSMLFKMGTIQGDDGLQLSKLHFTVIDELHNQIDNDLVLAELADKRDKLKNIALDQIDKIPKMKNVKLRPYQESGFQWMNMLDDMQWGGCLADDMGLGKTLQTLTFITHLIKKHPKSTHLIICPTSLIFNWENEIKKYAPQLNYHIYYGSERNKDDQHFNKYDVIITSYGTLRNDIERFNQFAFHYVILDESQAIKNPTAKLTKAVQLIKAKNKLLLSGTPVQNNTFDLYAQFNFLNPGMLGTMEFFRQQFANPIDKDGDSLASGQLQKLIYPFMLRRTKEQVAKDLPARTEMTMYCEMGAEQRKIYNQFKEYYRKYLLDKIKEEGMGKSGIYILEGLTKLRQICDSPALLNEDKRYPNESTKLEELIREIEENVGQHKALVFSQFVGMLDLIRQQLNHRKIAYEYIDGSVTAQNRQKAVENFQNNEQVKVFLISLKAGGVGLNLTAADYVYLVDPWWNPAVEQQAIDRTHRIGQTKKIFAYKMICKDSIEEKIIQLQDKKKAIAADIIKEENGFMKKLTKDDIEFLFS